MHIQIAERLSFVSGKDSEKVSSGWGFLSVLFETKGGANGFEGFIKGEMILSGVKLVLK